MSIKNNTSLLEKWLYLLQNIKDPEDIMVQNTKQEYSTMMTDEQLQAEALAHEIWLMDQSMYRKDARKEGLAEGRAEGLAQGLAEGREKARQEIIARLKTKGFSDQEIAELTELNS